ncbi:MAG TPA: thioredoxin, partial [Dongiaceae bacterium]|nr:thioredoxin [Dongiaceae bacterium]
MDNSTLTLGNGAAAAPPSDGGELVKDTTTQAFARDVLEESRRQPVLVDFWAPWCGPCKQLTPILERVVRGAQGAVRLVKMNIDDHPSIAGQLGIQSIPAVIAFVDGRPADGFVGALPESQVKAFIDRLAGPGAAGAVEELLAEADAMAASGAQEGAAERYLAVLQADPSNVHALAALARMALDRGDRETAEAMLARVPAASANDPEIAAIRAQRALAEQTAALGDEEPLRARIAADPKDFQARFDLALLRNAKGDRETA